jgi:hypothetical protein
MKHETIEKEIARRSALIYIPLTLGAVGLFLLATLLTGGYPLVARIGGAVWIGLLMTIVTMPLVTFEVKKRVMRK